MQCDRLGWNHVSIVQNREVSLVQRSVSTRIWLIVWGLSMAVCITKSVLGNVRSSYILVLCDSGIVMYTYRRQMLYKYICT